MAEQKKRKRSIRINTPTDVRRLLARTINDVKNSDRIDDEKKAQLIATLSNSMLRAFETTPVIEHKKKQSGALSELTKLIGDVARQIEPGQNGQRRDGQDGQKDD